MDFVTTYIFQSRDAYPKTALSRDKHGAICAINKMPISPTVNSKTKLAPTGTKATLAENQFHLHNPSGRTMALESKQPLTEMSTKNIS